MTPHNRAKKGEIAKTVLMPGDPLRAKYLADNFLTDVKLVNDVRNMLMYTGKYQGKLISVCGSGMGQPSIGIYSYELFKFYDVDRIIRIGSAGSYREDLKVYDVFLATEAYSDSKAFNKIAAGLDTHVTYPAPQLNAEIEKLAKEQKIQLRKGRIHSSDVFYAVRPLAETIKVTQADCVEQESAALFANAKLTGKQAACLVTISDNLITKEEISASKRQTTLVTMMKLALSLA